MGCHLFVYSHHMRCNFAIVVVVSVTGSHQYKVDQNRVTALFFAIFSSILCMTISFVGAGVIVAAVTEWLIDFRAPSVRLHTTF